MRYWNVWRNGSKDEEATVPLGKHGRKPTARERAAAERKGWQRAAWKDKNQDKNPDIRGCFLRARDMEFRERVEVRAVDPEVVSVYTVEKPNRKLRIVKVLTWPFTGEASLARLLRWSRGATLREAAAALRVLPSTLSGIENGRLACRYLALKEAYAKALGEPKP